MPIYEYECQKCKAIEEVLQRFSDPPVATCSQCSGPMSKLISQSSFHLKGDGWYASGYAKKPEPKSKATGKGDAQKAAPKKPDTDTSSSTAASTDE